MANVFISYARRDKARVVQLTNLLESEGLSVWWDSDLAPGGRYRQIIAEQLAIADSVIVVWTAAALQSDWVQDEAEEGRQRGVLIPVTLEPVRPPAGFRQVQAADLSQWTGSPEHPEFRSLVFAVRSLVQVGRASGKGAPPPKPGMPLAAEAPDVATVAEVQRAPPEPKPADAPIARMQQTLTATHVASSAKAPDISNPPRATFASAVSAMMFTWSWWLRTAVLMVACRAAITFAGDTVALFYILCVFPILAGAAAMACQHGGVQGAAKAAPAWIGVTVGALAAVAYALTHHSLMVYLVFGSTYFGSLAVSASFGLAAATVYLLGSFRRRA